MYYAVISYNSNNSFTIRSKDLDGLKDVLCTFSFPRKDVDKIVLYKSNGSKIAVIKEGRYTEES